MDKLKQLLPEDVKKFSVLTRKGEWVLLSSSGQAMSIAKTLIELIKIAYSNTKLGSFVKYKSDVGKSEYWEILDIDNDPEPDVCIFGRKAGPTEKWKGIKLQGLGHDGEKISKENAVKKLVALLNKGGFWIEASDAVEAVLRKNNVKVCPEESVSEAFIHGIEKYHNDGSYTRLLPNGTKITETSFGDLQLK